MKVTFSGVPRTAVDRVRQGLALMSLRQVDLARQAGLSVQAINDVLHGRGRVTIKFAQKAAPVLRTTPSWLLFGERTEEPAEGQAAGGPPGTFRFPVVSRVSADANARVAWDPITPPEWRDLPAGSRCFEVKGDSMRPLALEGQAVIVVEGVPRGGDLAAVELKDNRRLFKRYWEREGQVILESINPSLMEPPIVVKPAKVARSWRIIGVLF